ncbi:Programmed cell death toxin MazF like [hydrothermal vent metagenome]|uniref:Programmed cell death toxin MazF like n=1 Tax=hydrothermal vent metagenome TaxID=652676 RepID=A0A1W1EJQ5_9ZZZZ
MRDKIFIDTNILLYLYDVDGEKKSIAKEILKSNYYISTQVLNEFSNISLKKLKLNTDELDTILEKIIEKTRLFIFDEQTIRFAIKIKDKYKFQYYDSLIIATALENNCNILYSEDMQHNQQIESLTIINPFK